MSVHRCRKLRWSRICHQICAPMTHKRDKSIRKQHANVQRLYFFIYAANDLAFQRLINMQMDVKLSEMYTFLSKTPTSVTCQKVDNVDMYRILMSDIHVKLTRFLKSARKTEQHMSVARSRDRPQLSQKKKFRIVVDVNIAVLRDFWTFFSETPLARKKSSETGRW